MRTHAVLMSLLVFLNTDTYVLEQTDGDDALLIKWAVFVV